MSRDELVALVDEEGNLIGSAPRSECHSNPALMHGVARVLVFRGDGSLILQKRSRATETYPGLWDVSVGGHMEPDEQPKVAACREMQEELGIGSVPLRYLYQHVWADDHERELVFTFKAYFEGECRPDPGEVEEVRDWTRAEIEAALGTGALAPSFEEEWGYYERYARSHRD